MSFHLELMNIKKHLSTNGYPLFLIDKSFVMKVFSKPSPADINEDKKRIVVSLPFLGKISLHIKKRLITIFKMTAPHIKFASNITLKK